MEQDDKILRYKPAAEFLGMPPGTLYAKVSKKEIPHFRLGPRHVVFSRNQLKAYLERHQVEVTFNDERLCERVGT